MQQKLRRSIQQLAVKSGARELFGPCEHREVLDELETRLFLSDSPEMFHRVAQAIAAHLLGCEPASAVGSAIAKGIALYTDADSGNPAAERAAGAFLTGRPPPKQKQTRMTILTPEMLLDIASGLGYVAAGGCTGKRAGAILACAGKGLLRAAGYRWLGWLRPAPAITRRKPGGATAIGRRAAR